VTIVREDRSPGGIYGLWDAARFECSKPFSEEAEGLKENLKPYFSSQQIKNAARLCDGYSEVFSRTCKARTRTYRVGKVRIASQVAIDQKDLYDSVNKAGLMGPACAMAYSTLRDEIGAFRAQSLG
jgi:hypothetical protein